MINLFNPYLYIASSFKSLRPIDRPEETFNDLLRKNKRKRDRKIGE
jgi:hypothetical protein